MHIYLDILNVLRIANTYVYILYPPRSAVIPFDKSGGGSVITQIEW